MHPDTTKGSIASGVVEVKDPKLCSRVLYANPVVLLLTENHESKANVMVLSWLTPINNEGTFVFSINKSRHSWGNVFSSYHFRLAVPVQGMEKTLLQIGKVSGKYQASVLVVVLRVLQVLQDKFSSVEGLSTAEDLIAKCAAQIDCTKVRVQDADDRHTLVTAQINKCMIKEKYWNGKQFAPVSKECAPFLTFLGSQRFGYVQVLV